MSQARLCLLGPVLALLAPLHATTVPKMTFDEAVARASAIVHGKVVRSWVSWDAEHTAIWTHYELRVQDALKGGARTTITVSEPGGEIDGTHMQIPGAPRYEIGEEVVVFAAPTPIGYLRTCGWGQGKFDVRPASGAPSGRIVRSGLSGVQFAENKKLPGASQSLAALDGADLSSFLSRVRAAVAAHESGGSR